ncbi:MAG: DUF134 domain-containing protein [Syntrophales bacterium]|nr:DUF134 domain-containing protein [Syntrophales bacterium]
MPRPKCCRNVDGIPERTCFRPDGAASLSCREEVFLSIDEYESLRLADLEGLYQEQAAARMNISRQTFGRIVEAARRKVADVIVNGKTLRIEGGPISIHGEGAARCPRCRHALDLPHCRGESVCPHCRNEL